MIDRNRLLELKQEIGEEDFAEVGEVFLEEMQETLEALMQNAGSATAADFHGLRGSASNLGFVDFGAACSKAEQDVVGGATIDIAALKALFNASVAAAGSDLTG